MVDIVFIMGLCVCFLLSAMLAIYITDKLWKITAPMWVGVFLPLTIAFSLVSGYVYAEVVYTYFIESSPVTESYQKTKWK